MQSIHILHNSHTTIPEAFHLVHITLQIIFIIILFHYLGYWFVFIWVLRPAKQSPTVPLTHISSLLRVPTQNRLHLHALEYKPFAKQFKYGLVMIIFIFYKTQQLLISKARKLLYMIQNDSLAKNINLIIRPIGLTWVIILAW